MCTLQFLWLATLSVKSSFLGCTAADHDSLFTTAFEVEIKQHSKIIKEVKKGNKYLIS